MPQLGETVAEGKITKWFKTAGDAVKPGDNLFEIETDKTSMEVPSTTTGTLAEIRFKVGEVAKVGAVVAVISGSGAAQSPAVCAGVQRVPAARRALHQSRRSRSCKPRRSRVPPRWILFARCGRRSATTGPADLPAVLRSHLSRDGLPASAASICHAFPGRVRTVALSHTTWNELCSVRPVGNCGWRQRCSGKGIVRGDRL